MWKTLSLKGKTTGQTPNNFTIYQINYNNSCICLTVKKKISLIFLCSHTHFLCVSKAATLCSVLLNSLIDGGNSLLSPLWLSHRRRKHFALSFLLRSSQAKILFFTLLVSCSIFRLLIWRTLGPKAIKFFVTLSIYKTFFLFHLGPKIHYLFNKEFILS